VAEYTWLERPLVARKAIPARDGDVGIRLREVHGFRLNLLMVRRGRREAVAETAVKVFGMSMPRPGQTAVGGDTVLVWSSADQFLVLQRHDSPAALRQNFAGLASISEQADGRRLLELSGSRVRDLLAKLTSVDLTERVFPVGRAAATSIDHTPVNIWLDQGVGDRSSVFCLFIPATFAESMLATIIVAGAEYGMDVGAFGLDYDVWRDRAFNNLDN
jgi:methylglutamate dehydrogenase subunit D